MTKSNKEAGKGDKWRKGTNYAKYWQSELWDNLGKKTTQSPIVSGDVKAFKR